MTNQTRKNDFNEQKSGDSHSPGNVKIHYVYLTCDSRDGRLYWGIRSCAGLPENDMYFGSHTDTTFEPDLKWVWHTFPSREEAERAEQLLIKLFNSVDSSTFANLSSAQWKQWRWLGSHHTPKTKQLLSDMKLGEKNPMFGKTTSARQKAAVREAHTGKDVSEETRRLSSVSQKKARAERAHKRLFHHPETQQQRFFDPASPPEGWLPGEHPERKKLRPRGKDHHWNQRNKT